MNFQPLNGSERFRTVQRNPRATNHLGSGPKQSKCQTLEDSPEKRKPETASKIRRIQKELNLTHRKGYSSQLDRWTRAALNLREMEKLDIEYARLAAPWIEILDLGLCRRLRGLRKVKDACLSASLQFLSTCYVFGTTDKPSRDQISKVR